MYERMLNKNEKPTAEQLSFPMETTTDGVFPTREKESLSVMYFRKAVHLPLYSAI